MNERTRLLEERKRLLIASGAAYRVGVVEARQQVSANLQGESLAKKAMGQLALTAVAAFKSRKSGGLSATGLQTLLPLVVSGVSFLAKKTSAKPAVRKVVLAGAVGTLVAVLAKRKFTQWQQTRQEKARHKRRA
ncbi:MAG: hypothetical protein HYS18_15930 [Burkholderiales bacterium]|nr:hypothetical protein [Burkholderiales bacterium]